MPQISVIVPIYNAEKYLCRCLDSVLQQTMADFELLCIDDGTSGACSAVLRQYAEADKRIKVIRQKHLGEGLYLMTNTDTRTKIRDIKYIADSFNLDIKINTI